MNHKKKLLEIYENSSTVDDVIDVSEDIRNDIKIIGAKITSQKGVFTVLTTLVTHKILNPSQDIRKHQSSMDGGFSGRTIDTQYITPTLKELKLPSMAESGWLTRSLEQPYEYTLDYNGKISNKSVKKAFLQILDYLEKNADKATNILRLIIFQAIEARKRLTVEIRPLENPEELTIEKIIYVLNLQFGFNYRTHGGSKLPVIAFYSIYISLIEELTRFNGCVLEKMGSHTASDRTSKSSGDIEISKDGSIFESIEIKLDKSIDSNIVRIAIEKIKRFNPERYYILSYIGVKEDDKKEISNMIAEIKKIHGCQIIINGVIPSLKYYLRLISSLENFIKNYSSLIQDDTELKKVHKDKWNELIEAYLS
ncbi:restriction endonuclease, SacI family [uncultured Kordia sp.]|uniref:restriction endonuclease, SacI family n=1 Tax=uncultured Kordia sp. TaxID=507699 RepID=UPI0026158EF8|nr:restriction endonuclease, SacI family [uncultured Kordia sp.]